MNDAGNKTTKSEFTRGYVGAHDKVFTRELVGPTEDAQDSAIRSETLHRRGPHPEPGLILCH